MSGLGGGIFLFMGTEGRIDGRTDAREMYLCGDSGNTFDQQLQFFSYEFFYGRQVHIYTY